MKYLLVWSFIVNSHWITGTATFANKEECLKAEAMFKQHQNLKTSAFIGCQPVQPNKKAKDRSTLVYLPTKMDDMIAGSKTNGESHNKR